MKNIMKIFATIMVMIMVLTSSAPIVTEAKTKTSITVTNKATGKKVGKKVTLKAGQKLQLKVMYGKKNVTKKAKYKASNKHVTVSKKGKITAKTKGTSTVTITYKKKTKKIKVTVQKEKKSTEQKTTEQKTVEEAVEEIKAKHTFEEDPNPKCNHVWRPTFISDISNINEDNFSDLWNDHLFLSYLQCVECGTCAVTTSMSVMDVLDHVNENWKCVDGSLDSEILYYMDERCWPSELDKQKIKHTHKYRVEFTPFTKTWDMSYVCTICGYNKEVGY